MFSMVVSGDGLVRLVAFWSASAMVILLTSFVHTVVDQLVMAEKRANTIAREMQHRIRNSLTLVQAIARQTFRSSRVSRKLKTFLLRGLLRSDALRI